MSFKYKFYALVGSIVAIWIGFSITQWCETEPMCWVENGAPVDYHWFMYAGVIGFVVCALNFFIDGVTLDDGSFLKEVVFHKYTQEDIDALYSPDEAWSEEEERENYNDHARSDALWSPFESDANASYIDYDGYKRNAASNELMFMNSKNTGNGKRR